MLMFQVRHEDPGCAGPSPRHLLRITTPALFIAQKRASVNHEERPCLVIVVHEPRHWGLTPRSQEPGTIVTDSYVSTLKPPNQAAAMKTVLLVDSPSLRGFAREAVPVVKVAAQPRHLYRPQGCPFWTLSI